MAKIDFKFDIYYIFQFCYYPISVHGMYLVRNENYPSCCMSSWIYNLTLNGYYRHSPHRRQRCPIRFNTNNMQQS